MSPIIIAIVAFTKDTHAIGKHNDLPWTERLTDVHALRKLLSTTDAPDGFNAVIMGRKLFEAFPNPHKGQFNIILSTTLPDFSFVARSVQEALALANGAERIFVLGGGSVFEQMLPLCSEVYATEVDVSVPECDTFFPSLGSFHGYPAKLSIHDDDVSYRSIYYKRKNHN